MERGGDAGENGTGAKVMQRVKDRSKMKERINTRRKDQKGTQI